MIVCWFMGPKGFQLALEQPARTLEPRPSPPSPGKPAQKQAGVACLTTLPLLQVQKRGYIPANASSNLGSPLTKAQDHSGSILEIYKPTGCSILVHLTYVQVTVKYYIVSTVRHLLVYSHHAVSII